MNSGDVLNLSFKNSPKLFSSPHGRDLKDKMLPSLIDDQHRPLTSLGKTRQGRLQVRFNNEALYN